MTFQLLQLTRPRFPRQHGTVSAACGGGSARLRAFLPYFQMILAVLLLSASARAQVTYTGTAASQNFGSQAVGAASTATTLNFSITSGTTVGRIGVVTTGIENLDFTNASGGTCRAQDYTSATTCTVNVTFKPKFAGPRKGAVVFYSEAGNTGMVLGQVLVYGTGTGPQIGYSPEPSTSFSLGCCSGLFLSNVRGMTVDAAGNQFIASVDGNYVVELPAVGGTSAAIAISPVVNGKGLSGPSGVAVDGAGNLLIGDSNNNRVVVVPVGGGAATAIDPTVNGKGLSQPFCLAVNGAGDLFIADANNGRVVEVPAGGGASIAISPVADGKGLSAWVPDVAVDAAGDVFILDENNARVVEVPAGGGTPLAIAPKANGVALSNPYGIAVDAAGDLFITDNPNVRVVEVPAGGGPAIAFAPGLYNPVGLAFDGPGNLYIVDNSHTRILELQRSLSPALNFPTSTPVGSTDTTDGTQTVTVQNIGNEALTLSALSYPADFSEASGDTNACTGSTSLGAGQTCDLPVEFAPLDGGALSEVVTLTDNALNTTGAQQSIAVSGTGYAEVEGATHFSVTSTSLASVVAGTPFSIKVTALNLAGSTATTYNGTVSFTSSDPGFVNTGPLTLSNGTGQATVTLQTLGTQTITATDTTTSAVAGSGSFSVIPVPILPTSGTPSSVNFGPQPVGSASAAQTLTFSIPAGTTVGSIGVVTTGIENLDFTNAGGGTCAAQDYTSTTTCTVNVTFKPKYAGPRMGAVVFYSEAKNTGTVLGQALIYGVGTGPQIGYSPSPATSFSRGCCSGLFVSNVTYMAVDAAGNQFLSSADGNYVLEFPAVGGAGAAIEISPVVNGLGLNIPIGIAIDGAGDLLISDANNNRVVVVPPGGGAATAIDPTVDGKGLSSLSGVLVTGAGDLFIGDNGRVVKLPAGGGAPIAISPVADGKALSKSFLDMALDAAGDLFILDFGNNRIVKVPAGGGTPIAIAPTVDGVAFSSPLGLAVDVAGNLFTNSNWSLVEVPAGGGPAFAIDLTAFGGLAHPWGLAFDGPGNLYIVDNSHTRVLELQRSLSPALNFPTSTPVGSTDTTDGTQTVQIQNLGNETLTLSALSYPADFPEATGDSNACTGSTSMGAGQGCDLPIEFVPTESGPLSEAVTLTDNALNASPNATQAISLTGQGSAPLKPTKLAFTAPPPASLKAGKVPGTAAVSVEDTSNTVVTSSSATITLSVIGPNSYSKVYTATASNGVATFSSLASLNIPGTYSYTATDTPDGLTQAVTSETVTSLSPFGELDKAEDSVTFSTTVGQSGSVEITGWVADPQDGAPMSNVKMYIDGTSIGTPTLGIAVPAVAALKGNNAYLLCGYQMVYSASSLSLGTHNVTVIATDSLGLSTTFGPVSFTVAATAGVGVPFGVLSSAVDSVTSSATVGQSDSVNIQGWVGDPQDHAPLTNVTVYIDGASIGAPTLGIARPAVASLYGSAYLNSGYQLLYQASSLSLGSHNVTVIAIDSGGRSTTFGPVTFTVAATAGAGSPFGILGEAVDSVTLSTTVSQSDSVKISGWVFDRGNITPITNVTVYIDGTSIGTPTLGLARPTVAADYGSSYRNSGYQMLYPASSLSQGAHSATVIAIDSGGRSTTFGPVEFTVQ